MDNQNYDIGIDEAKAKIWMADVTNELNSVDDLLKKVSHVSYSIPGEDDIIFKGFDVLGHIMSDAWTQMCDILKKSHSLLGSLIEDVGKSGQSVYDDIESFINKFRR